ncbi:MAG: heme utilization cystosolic carrier protein HutX [Proteobacteria bacterium]|nr:MAG: heme utilization cystosolic carrier protein HutX [Pseudomonadota bacterium]
MSDLQQKIKEQIQKDDKYTVAKLAQALNVKEIDILLNLPNEVATHANGDKFDEIIGELETWGEVLIVKNTPSFILEIRSKIGKGSYMRGYYNFSHEAPLSGHLKASDIDKIVFLSAKVVMGMISHSVMFLDKDGNDIFKVYVARDKNREFIPEQLEKFQALKKSFEK